MGSKIGFILSLVFVFQTFLLGGDILSIQIIRSDLDSLSQLIAQKISKIGKLDDSIKVIAANNQVEVKCISNCFPQFGDQLTFTLTHYYYPLIISSEEMMISITRSVVIGYYN
ncbi:MAG TPA: hypothetical protein PKC96_06835 [Bacilli bacterium]|nr:hypothetical protein [Bacilli bacterium]